MRCFAGGSKLPAGYGRGLDERCIEYPWALSQLPEGAERLLDAGSTFNHERLLQLPVLATKQLCILTLAPERQCFWNLGIDYLFHDLRDIPLRDGLFDTVMCVSTLEHVGFDNSHYTGTQPAPTPQGDFRTAVRELSRVLKPGGTFLLTVPFGKHRAFPCFQQFDEHLLCTAIEAFGPASATTTSFYRYSAGGWQLADAAACADSEYVEWITKPRDQWPAEQPVEADLAAAARAVACVRITKS